MASLEEDHTISGPLKLRLQPLGDVDISIGNLKQRSDNEHASDLRVWKELHGFRKDFARKTYSVRHFIPQRMYHLLVYPHKHSVPIKTVHSECLRIVVFVKLGRLGAVLGLDYLSFFCGQEGLPCCFR